jgi:hypothetical protein
MKHTQRGSATLIVLACIAVVAVGLFFWAIGIRNDFVKLENGIVAANESRQTTLSNISQKVKESIGIRGMSVEDIKATVNEQIKARSGDKNPIVNMVTESNVAPSPALYEKIMNIIDAGREGFLRSENMMVDRKRVACDISRKWPHGAILGFFDLPKLHTGCDGDTDDFKVLKNDKSEESFRTGTDGGLY